MLCLCEFIGFSTLRGQSIRSPGNGVTIICEPLSVCGGLNENALHGIVYFGSQLKDCLEGLRGVLLLAEICC